jgi:hypothetical protein
VTSAQDVRFSWDATDQSPTLAVTLQVWGPLGVLASVPAVRVVGTVTDRAGDRGITRVDVPPEVLALATGSGVVNIPVEEVRAFVRPACRLCFDPTSEFADVAVGSTEQDPAWNTLVVRTARGRDLVGATRAAGVIETRPYPAERLPLLRRAVRNKKLRVLADPAAGDARSYVGLNPACAQALQEEGGAAGEF